MQHTIVTRVVLFVALTLTAGCILFALLMGARS